MNEHLWFLSLAGPSALVIGGWKMDIGGLELGRMVRVGLANLWGGVAIVLIICCCSLAWADVKYGGGTGEPNDPYQILDANDMQAIGADANDWDKCFVLMADIDLRQFTGDEFNIIAPDMNDAVWWFEGAPFTGVFDGNDHTISNFTYNSNGINFIGLFGCIDGPHAQIKNLTLDNPNVNPAGDSWSVGALAGMLKRGTITDCAVEGGSVSGDYRIGGMVGIHCGTMLNCYATSSVRGDFGDAGGLVGNGDANHVATSFWDVNTTGQSTSAGGTGKTTAEMQTKSTFAHTGWNFVDLWTICERTNYPRFIWQISVGDSLCPNGVDFIDYSFFASHWREENCGASNDCDGTDLDLLGTVEINDLRTFVDNWLRGF